MIEVYYKFIDYREHWTIVHKLSSKGNSSWTFKSDSDKHPTMMMWPVFVTGTNSNLQASKYKMLYSDAELLNAKWEAERQEFIKWYADFRDWVAEKLDDASKTFPPLFADPPGEYCPFQSTTLWPDHPIGMYNYMPGSDGPFYGVMPDYAQCTLVVSMGGFYQPQDGGLRTKTDIKSVQMRGAPLAPVYDRIGASLGSSFDDIFAPRID